MRTSSRNLKRFKVKADILTDDIIVREADIVSLRILWNEIDKLKYYSQINLYTMTKMFYNRKLTR